MNGAQRRPGMTHPGLDLLVDVVAGTEDRAAKRAAVPIDVFGRRIHHDVGAQLERPLENRGGENVVDDDQRAGGMCHPGDRFDVDHGLHRIRGRLEEHCFRGSRQRLLPLVEVFSVDEVGVNAPAGEQLVKDQKAGAEQPPSGDYPVAGLQDRCERIENRSHSARRSPGCLCTLEQPQPLFEHRNCRVAVSRVDVAFGLSGKGSFRLFCGRVDVAGGQE